MYDWKWYQSTLKPKLIDGTSNGYRYFFGQTYMPKVVPNQSNQPSNLNLWNGNIWDFFVEKNRFWTKIKKIPTRNFNRGIPNRLKSTNFPTSIQEPHHTCKDRATERWSPAQRLVVWSRAGVRSIFGNVRAYKLLVRHILQCRWRQTLPQLADWSELQRCNLQGVCTFLLPLASRHAHAATPMH